MVLASIISFIYSILRTFYFLPVQLPSELQEILPGTTNVGVISLTEENEEFDIYDEPIQSMITNIMILCESMDSKSKTLMITGATSAIGKTMLSNTISKSLSERGKKVIVLDLDFKRGDLERFYGTNKLKNYDTDKILNEIEEFKYNDNLYMIPRPRKHGSKALSIIDSPNFSNFVIQLKKEFDIVLFDTPPVLSVSEPISLNNLPILIYL